jgi:hypothetical protein
MNKAKHLKRAGRLAVAATMLALVVVPSASSKGVYADPAGDSGSAGDITGINVTGDEASGQLIFTINGTNLIYGADHFAALAIDSDANPLTGNPGWVGADYLFGFGADGYSFAHWTGSEWDWDTPYTTVHVHYAYSGVTVSVNRSEIGNTTEFNFAAEAADFANERFDNAPDDGTFNYSLDADGVDIVSVDVQTVPVSGPKAGKSFVLTPTSLRLPPDGRDIPAVPQPESYSCKATLNGKSIVGSGTGGCTWRMPKKARGETLKVVLTVTYQGTSKSFPYVFKVR